MLSIIRTRLSQIFKEFHVVARQPTEHPQTLTHVSDWGKRVQPTTLRLERRRRRTKTKKPPQGRLRRYFSFLFLRAKPPEIRR
ncbi:hypothetical protein CEQ31_005665 [Serratia odorifera]|nr:hypothetical protein CEQ31_005665 [Serratia odorifera]RII70221.1 hypothetical protein DX901_20640 [Serratia odorifera]